MTLLRTASTSARDETYQRNQESGGWAHFTELNSFRGKVMFLFPFFFFFSDRIRCIPPPPGWRPGGDRSESRGPFPGTRQRPPPRQRASGLRNPQGKHRGGRHATLARPGPRAVGSPPRSPLMLSISSLARFAAAVRWSRSWSDFSRALPGLLAGFPASTTVMFIRGFTMWVNPLSWKILL